MLGRVNIADFNSIAADMALGMSEEAACLRQGINHETWVSAKRRVREFSLAIKKAMAEFQHDALVQIRDGRENWTSLAWILERRHKPDFSRAPDVQTQQQQLTEIGGCYFSPAEWDEIVELARRGPDHKTDQPGKSSSGVAELVGPVTYFPAARTVEIYRLRREHSRAVTVANWVQLAQRMQPGDSVDVEAGGPLRDAGVRCGFVISARKLPEGGYAITRLK